MFWKDLFETHKKALSKITKLKNDNDKQIIKWLQSPHTLILQNINFGVMV